MKMRKGAAVGGGVSGIIFLAIIIFVIVKIGCRNLPALRMRF